MAHKPTGRPRGRPRKDPLDTAPRPPRIKKTKKRWPIIEAPVREIPPAPLRADKVDFIAELMTALEWDTKVYTPLCTSAWGIAKSTLAEYSSEASRRVTSALARPEIPQREISAGCRKLFHAAVKEGDARAAMQAGGLWAKVSGAEAPAQHVVTTTGATPQEAARLIREQFGNHAAKPADEVDDGAEAVPDTSGE